MRHGKEKSLLKELSALKRPRGEAGEVVRRNQNYFATHAWRINYQGWRGEAGPLEAAQWNQRAAPGKCASSVQGSSGRRQGCGISVPRKKPVRMATGTNSGTRTDGGAVKVRPGSGQTTSSC